MNKLLNLLLLDDGSHIGRKKISNLILKSCGVNPFTKPISRHVNSVYKSDKFEYKTIIDNKEITIDIQLFELPPVLTTDNNIYNSLIIEPLQKHLSNGTNILLIVNNIDEIVIRKLNSTFGINRLGKIVIERYFTHVFNSDDTNNCIIIGYKTTNYVLSNDKENNYYFNYCKELNNIIKSLDKYTIVPSFPVMTMETDITSIDTYVLKKQYILLVDKIIKKWLNITLDNNILNNHLVKEQRKGKSNLWNSLMKLF